MKRIILLAIVLISAMSVFSLQISEFIVTPTASEQIEIYNDGASDIDLSGYYIVISGSGWSDTAQFLADTITAGEYKSYYMNDFDPDTLLGLPNGGATIAIYDASMTLLDEVAYGTMGPAPAPIYNFSTARVSSTGDNAIDFNMDDSPTMGTANDASATALGTGSVFINELYPDTLDTLTTQFIELYNNSASAVDISGWVIVCNDDYYISSGTTLNAGAYFVLYQSDFPPYFYFDQTYDNVYLYNSNFERIDQVGYDEVPSDSSFSVIPNGTRTVFDGYDNATCTDFENAAPTPGASNDPAGVITSNSDNINISICNAGILIDNANNINGKLSIIDITGRTIYKSDIKNMIFATKSGVYFVKLNIGDKEIIKKINLIK